MDVTLHGQGVCVFINSLIQGVTANCEATFQLARLLCDVRKTLRTKRVHLLPQSWLSVCTTDEKLQVSAVQYFRLLHTKC